MKKLLFVLFAALAFVACEKDIPQATQFVGITPEKVVLEKETGGSITIETSDDSFVDAIGTYIKVNVNGYDGYEITNTKSFFNIYPPLYLVKFDDIIKYKEYEGLGCKVVPDGFQKFNIIVEPNCDCDFIEIHFNRIIESKEYGKIGGHGGSSFNIFLK